MYKFYSKGMLYLTRLKVLEHYSLQSIRNSLVDEFNFQMLTHLDPLTHFYTTLNILLIVIILLSN